MTDSPAPSGRWLAAVLVALAVGVVVAGYLTALHLDLFYGAGVADTLCDLGHGFNCSTVNGSAESELFGIPHALLAIPAYLTMAALAWRGRRDAGARGLLFGVSLASVAYGGWLLWVSATKLHAWCVLCLTMDAVNVAVAALAGASKPKAPSVPALGVAAVAFALTGGVAWGAYGHQRDTLVAATVKAAVAAPAPAKAATTAQAAGPGLETKQVRVSDKREDIAVPKDAPARGPSKARVQIVEFSDFQCPFCKRLAGSLKQLGEEYPDDVRVVYLDYPLNQDCNPTAKKSMHPGACDAAKVARCAHQQGKFWEMHDRLFAQQADFSVDTAKGWARELGLDGAKFDACLEDDDTLAAVRANAELGGAHGVSGTPTFFVNGRQMSGGHPVEVLRAVVDAELAGNTGPLALDVQIGVEETGAITGKPDAVDIATASHPFRIDAFEASLDGAKAVSKAGAPAARNVSWYDAKAACEAAGKRLCTEEEWLSACTGAKPTDADRNGVFSDDDQPGALYAYGPEHRSGKCADSRNPQNPGEVVAGNHPNCVTPTGVYDLVGNVKEWVGLTPMSAAVKGGSFASGESARCGYYRDDVAPEAKDDSTGFRCCEGPAPEASPSRYAGRQVGDALAPFDVPLVDGGTFSSKSLKGKPAIVVFWASWCGPCRKEMPALAKLYDQYKDRGLQIVGVSVDKTADAAKKFLATQQIGFPIALDATGALKDSFDTRGIPSSFWIKRDGTIRLRTTGIPPNGDKRLDELVQELLAD